MILVASSSGQARAVRLRTNPRLPLANAYLAMLPPLAVSMICTTSLSPEVRKICLISQPHFFGEILRRVGAFKIVFDFANAALREVQGHDEQHTVLLWLAMSFSSGSISQKPVRAQDQPIGAISSWLWRQLRRPTPRAVLGSLHGTSQRGGRMHKRKSTLRWNEKRVSVRPRRMAKTDSRAAAHGNGYGSLLERARSRLITIIFVLCCTLDAHSAGAQMLTCASEVPPSEQLGELFRNVQLRGIFPDSKTLADLHFDDSPNTILADYEAHKVESGFDLGAFVRQHFSLPTEGPTVHPASPGEPIDKYIARLWDVLRHQSDETSGHSSLLPLPYPYVVPGGRFRELYYWDSYFTMLGLEANGRHDLALNMLKDFAFEIDCYGHVPNGNRTYYLSRSPPFFSLMVDLIAEREGDASYV